MSRLKRTRGKKNKKNQSVKYPKESPNTTRTNINEFREVARYKINIQKLSGFEYC